MNNRQITIADLDEIIPALEQKNSDSRLLEELIEYRSELQIAKGDIIKALQRKINAIYKEASAEHDEDEIGDVLHNIVCICEGA